jgi:hypothetical protein
MKKSFIILLPIILFCSCYVTKYEPISNTLNPYLGQSQHEVILKLGAPDRITPDGNGGTILVYEKTSYVTVQRLDLNPYSDVLTNSYTTSNNSYLQFYIDKNGTVYNWRTNLLGKPIRVKDTIHSPRARRNQYYAKKAKADSLKRNISQ